MSTRKTQSCGKHPGRPRGTEPEDLTTPLQRALYDYFVVNGSDERWDAVDKSKELSRSSIDRWIAGTAPKYDKLLALAAATGVPASEWLRDSQTEAPSVVEPPGSTAKLLDDRRVELLRRICQLPRRVAELHEQILECDEVRLGELEALADELEAWLQRAQRASDTG